ncbi:MAG TPA: hypothetical protein VGK23_03180 [Methanomassiliicoccales archaeon]|jgi:hypothetical protein
MRIISIIAVAIVSALILTSTVMQPWNNPDQITLQVIRGYGANNDSVLVNYSITSSQYSDPINIVLIPLDRYESKPIFIFADRGEYSVQDYARVLGLYDHLSAEMANLGSNQSVTVVDRSGVVDVLRGDPSVLIIVNSTEDWSDQSGAMLSWVDKGGVIFGLGMGALPFISTENGGNDSRAPYDIRYETLEYEGGNGVLASASAAGLDMRYLSPKFGMRAGDVEQYGHSIGYLYSRESELTSAALIHRGNGSIVLFSDIMEQPFTTSMEDAVAGDVAKMLVSGLPWESGPLHSIQVNGSQNHITGSFIVNVSPSSLMSCFAFSLADHQHRNRLLIL